MYFIDTHCKKKKKPSGQRLAPILRTECYIVSYCNSDIIAISDKKIIFKPPINAYRTKHNVERLRIGQNVIYKIVCRFVHKSNPGLWEVAHSPG